MGAMEANELDSRRLKILKPIDTFYHEKFKNDDERMDADHARFQILFPVAWCFTLLLTHPVSLNKVDIT